MIFLLTCFTIEIQCTVVTYYVFKDWEQKKYNKRFILNIGSTTDRVKRAKTNL